jgi:hypothetical protein
MRIRTAGQESELELASGRALEHLGEHRRGFVVTDDEIIPRARIHRDPGVAKVAVDDPRLVLLVVVHPQLESRLAGLHRIYVKGHRSAS